MNAKRISEALALVVLLASGTAWAEVTVETGEAKKGVG